jgi:hypothetical protein
MPYRSEKQRRYFHVAEARGDISSKVVKEFDQASKGMSLPEAIKKKKKEDSMKKLYQGGTCASGK